MINSQFTVYFIAKMPSNLLLNFSFNQSRFYLVMFNLPKQVLSSSNNKYNMKMLIAFFSFCSKA